MWAAHIFNPLNAKLNPICHLLALLGGATIVVVRRLRVNIRSVEICLRLANFVQEKTEHRKTTFYVRITRMTIQPSLLA